MYSGIVVQLDFLDGVFWTRYWELEMDRITQPCAIRYAHEVCFPKKNLCIHKKWKDIYVSLSLFHLRKYCNLIIIIIIIIMAPSNNGKLSMKQKILNATASLKARGIDKAPRSHVSKLCGVSKETKSYSNCLGQLKKEDGGLIIVEKDYLIITDKGMEMAVPEAPLGNNTEALGKAKEQFKSSKQKKILDILSDGKAHTYKDIATLIDTDHTKKSFGNLLGPLRTAGYAATAKTENGEKSLEGTEQLFPFGKPSE